MAWVLIGAHKINTAMVCYAEMEGDTLRIYFNGEWEGNPIDLHFDEAKALWKYMKAEDVMLMSRDKGSAAVLPRAAGPGKSSSGMYDVDAAKEGNAEKPKPPSAPVQHKPAEPKK